MKNRIAKTAQRVTSGGTNFLVSVYHQENHSWQGSIQWLDTGQKVHFRSELEMLNLMQEAIAQGKASSEGQRTWEKEKSKNTG